MRLGQPIHNSETYVILNTSNDHDFAISIHSHGLCYSLLRNSSHLFSRNRLGKFWVIWVGNLTYTKPTFSAITFFIPFLFQRRLRQTDGVLMGSPLAPVIAILFREGLRWISTQQGRLQYYLLVQILWWYVHNLASL